MNRNDPTSEELNQRLGELFSRLNYERSDRPTPDSFKLDNMRALMKELGDPQLAYPIIHVTGTKGKGSVSAIAASILSDAGFRVGLYSSPHLETFHQRFRVNGQPIGDDSLLKLLDQVAPAVAEIDRQNSDTSRVLTFFEVSTAMMFQHFCNVNVDVAVVEVGLGGRLDSTNICQSSVSVITNISMDHMAQLGNTIAAIASEKAGIIKQDVPVISGIRASDALAVIEEKARESHSPLSLLGRNLHFQIAPEQSGKFQPIFDFEGKVQERQFRYRHLKVGLGGSHQVENASLAIAAVHALAESDSKFEIATSNPSIESGLENVRLAGRIERVELEFEGTRHSVVLDIAHNPASMKTLLDTIPKIEPTSGKLALNVSQIGKLHPSQTTESTGIEADPGFQDKKNVSETPATFPVVVFACSRDKEAGKMLELLKPNCSTLILTEFKENPRAFSSKELLEIAQAESGGPGTTPQIIEISDPVAAAQTALRVAGPGQLVVIAGSAFLVAELRPWLKHLECHVSNADIGENGLGVSPVSN